MSRSTSAAVRGSLRHGSLCLLLALVLLGCGDQRPELVPVPRPDLEAMEAAVRRQLEEELGALEALRHDAGTGAGRLAEAFGELGRRFQVYELSEAAEACYENARRLAPGEFRWVYHLGVVLQAGGRFEEAAELFEQALGIRPDDLPAKVRLGEVRRELGRSELAREALEEALGIDPDCALAHYFLGQLESAAGAHSAAVERFEEALRLQPGASVVHYPLAQAYRALGDEEKAARLLARLGSEPVRLEDPLIQGLEELRTGAAAHIRRAARAQIDGAYAAALAEYRRAVEADPDNPEAHQGLGLMMAQEGDLEGAVGELRQALRLSPDDPRLLSNLAGLLARQGSFEEAIGLYDAALERDPGLVIALRGRAEAEAGAGRLADAVATLDRVVALDPSAEVEAGVHSRAAEFLARQGAVDRAVSRYEQAVAASPRFVEAHFGLANLLGRAGQFRRAAAAYRRVLELEPRHTPSRLGEATALVLAGDYGEALRRLEEGLRAQPDQGDLAHALARLLVTCPDAAVRDGARALELAEAVHRAAPTLDSAETVAMALAELGRFDEAAARQRRLITEMAGGPPELLARLRANLERYESHQPVRQQTR